MLPSDIENLRRPRTDEERRHADNIAQREDHLRQQQSVLAAALQPALDLYDLFEVQNYRLSANARFDACLISENSVAIRIAPESKDFEITEFMQAWYKANSTRPIRLVLDESTGQVQIYKETARLRSTDKKPEPVGTYDLADSSGIASCLFDQLTSLIDHKDHRNNLNGAKNEIMDFVLNDGPVPEIVDNRQQVLQKRQDRAETRQALLDTAKKVPGVGLVLRKLGF